MKEIRRGTLREIRNEAIQVVIDLVDGYTEMQERIRQAKAMLEENIANEPPHGCKRDEVLAVLKGEA